MRCFHDLPVLVTLLLIHFNAMRHLILNLPWGLLWANAWVQDEKPLHPPSKKTIRHEEPDLQSHYILMTNKPLL